MKKPLLFTVIFSLLVLTSAISFVFGRQYQQGYVLEHEADLAQEQKPPHDGVGLSTAYSFFANAPGLKFAFRKRVLKPGSAIGYHLQNEDEVYYIVSDKCTECVGFHDEPQCAAVCPVDCCVDDEDVRETKEELLAKKEWLHMNE